MSASFTPKPVTIDQLTPGTPVWVALYAGGAFIAGTVKYPWASAGMVEVDQLDGLTGYVVAPLDRIVLRTTEGD